MAVKVVNRTYSEAFTNGTTNWLLGNVGEWQKLLLDIEASVSFQGSNADTIDVSSTNQTIKMNNGKTWAEYGFDIGQQCRLTCHYYHENTWDLDLTCIFTIVNIYNDVIETTQLNWISVIVPNPPPPMTAFPADPIGDLTLPANTGTKVLSNLKIYTNAEPEGCRLLYTHLTNDDYQNQQLPSLIDGSVTEFIKPDVKSQPLNVAQAMSAVGLQSGMSVRGVTVKRKGLKAGSYNIYTYEIELQYLISSFFSSVQDLEDGIMPEYLTGDGSLTDNYRVMFFPKWNNPNTVIQNDLAQTERLGNTGWFNENFNALVNNYSLTNLEYYDTNGNITTAIDYFAPTKVKAIINNVLNVNATTECGFGFMWLPKDDVNYKQLLTPFYRNTFVNTGDPDNGYAVGTFYPATMVGGGIASASMDVKNVKFTDLGGGKIAFEAIFIPNANFYATFDAKPADDRKYLLWLSVANSALIRNYSDRVSLILDIQPMVKTVPPAGEYGLIQNVFIEHPYNESATGTVNYDGFVQDDILCRVPFLLNPLTTVFKNMRMGIEVFNPSTDVSFVLEKHDVNMAQFFNDANGVPQFNYNQSRGFKLEQTNSKNWVKINREPLLDNGVNYGYLAYYGFKIRYEDWLQLAGMPADFFTAGADHNGFNHDWFHHITALGWVVNFFTEIDAIDNGTLKRYKNQFNFKFGGYDTNTTKITTAHRFIRHSDNSILNVGNDPATGKPLGVILSNEATRIEIDYEIVDAGVWDLNNLYATITIEVDKGQGIMEMRQISSVVVAENDNPLIGISPATLVTASLDVTNKILTTKCLVDPNLLDDAIRYRITGRVGCYDSGLPPFSFGKYEARYEARYE